MVIVADDALKTGTLMHIAAACEKAMVEFKLVPTCFPGSPRQPVPPRVGRGHFHPRDFASAPSLHPESLLKAVH